MSSGVFGLTGGRRKCAAVRSTSSCRTAAQMRHIRFLSAAIPAVQCVLEALLFFGMLRAFWMPAGQLAIGSISIAHGPHLV
jgi:hypothetical protein